MSEHIIVRAGSLVVLSGLPGAGKSSLRRNVKGLEHIPGGLEQAWVSTDELRERILGSVTDLDSRGPCKRLFEEANTAVFPVAQAIVQKRLSQGLTTFVDATSIDDSERGAWARLAAEAGAPFLVLILGTPLEKCLENNAGRKRRVPESAIYKMAGKAPGAEPTAGFSATSRFPHRLISSDAVIEVRPVELEHENYDIVGDVHGLLDELLALLARAGWTCEEGRLRHPQERKLLFLGDLVDRGPQSIELVRLVKRAVEDGVALCLMGNHEKKLVRFVETALAEGIREWTSYANAETGMKLLQLPAAERDSLVAFLKQLPSWVAYEPERLAFVHGDIHRFEPHATLKDDMVHGQSRRQRGLDSDAEYERRYAAGLNRYVVFRGHIPQTSPQEHIFSLERHAFQKGELVLMRLSEFLALRRAGRTNQEAFKASLLVQPCGFDFEAYSRKWELVRAMESLAGRKLVTRQLDDTNLLRVYKYSKQTFWNNGWSASPWLLKARGIVLDAAGNIVSHPFDKTFNYAENGTGLDIADDHKVVAVDKLNGFLGIASRHPHKRGELLLHTQGGFGGPFVEYIRQYAYEKDVRSSISRFLAKHDVTLMFEVLHPDDPHIIEYAPEMMGIHLIGIRGKSLCDEPWTEEQVDAAAAEMGLRRPRWWRTTFGELRAYVREARTEGVMVREDDKLQRTLLKFKTPYYLTTKFLGRLSASRIKHMYGNPAHFKQTVDEEFYPLVNQLVARFSPEDLLAMSDVERVAAVRGLVHELFEARA